MKRWPFRAVTGRCAETKTAAEVAAEWARMGREFTSAEFRIEVFERLGMRDIYLRKAGPLVVGASYAGAGVDAIESVRDRVIAVCTRELQKRYPNGAPHFIDHPDPAISSRRLYKADLAVRDPRHVDDHAVLYAGQALDLLVHRDHQVLIAAAMRMFGINASLAAEIVNTPDEIRTNLMAGRPAGAAV